MPVRKDYRWFCRERKRRGQVLDADIRELILKYGLREYSTRAEYRALIDAWLTDVGELIDQVEYWL